MAVHPLTLNTCVKGLRYSITTGMTKMSWSSIFHLVCSQLSVYLLHRIFFRKAAFLDVLAYPVHSKTCFIDVLCSNCLIYSCRNYSRQKKLLSSWLMLVFFTLYRFWTTQYQSDNPYCIAHRIFGKSQVKFWKFMNWVTCIYHNVSHPL